MLNIDSLLSHIAKTETNPRYPERIESLKRLGRDTTLIDRGIQRTCQVLETGANSFVVYGEPQSGKTEFMIALTCKLLDIGYQTIFIVMNDNTELELQNFQRFQAAVELNPAPVQDGELATLSDDQLKQKIPRVIFCRKNSKNLERLIEKCRFMTDRVVIDDEADYASPDTNINKAKEASAINKKVGALTNTDSGGVYIGVTATPGRLDLNNTFMNDSKDWIFLDSYNSYKGREFFFPLSEEKQADRQYMLELLPDQGDDPKHLRDSILRFLVRVALLNINNTHELSAYSMLIHTAGKTDDHVEDKKIVDKVAGELGDPSGKGRKVVGQLIQIAHKLLNGNEELAHRIIIFILRNIGKRQILIINHKKENNSNVKRASEPKVLFTFAVGGNIVSRGLTFENLLTFFFSRNVKGKLQQNTYIQRARMFGNRPYHEHFELCVPRTLFENWADCFQDHELTLRLAKSGNLVHIQRSTNRAADTASVDKKNIIIGRGEREVGGIFELTSELEFRLLNHDGDPVELINSLLSEGLLAKGDFASEILAYIAETSSKGSQDRIMVLKSGKNGVKSIENINLYKDGDNATITRARGGIIQAVTNKSHYILPIKNDDGYARFLYKANLGNTILQNVRKTRSN